MSRLKFGTFLAPHHPAGEHPALLFQRDIALAAQLDELGFDEFWVGEHNSSGWEMISSPELFLAAAGQRTSNIKLGTGVVSLPYHHPYTTAARIVQLDHMTKGRVIFGTGPGALPSDAYMLNIDPMVQRDRQDEAIGVIKRLLRGETVTHTSEWFTMREAVLQLLPYQEEMEMVAASSISPSGMKLAGKYGMGVLSVASTSDKGLAALPTQWAFAEESAAKHGNIVDRRNWRVVMSFHLAESKKQAEAEAVDGLHRWHNEYNIGVLGMSGSEPIEDKWDCLAQTTGQAVGRSGTTIIGTPDEAVAAIKQLRETTGGFGVVLCFAHDWANLEATRRSYELFARFVIPEINGHTAGIKKSVAHTAAHRAEFIGSAVNAIMAKVAEDDRAAAEMKITMKQLEEQNKR